MDFFFLDYPVLICLPFRLREKKTKRILVRTVNSSNTDLDRFRFPEVR